MVICLCVFGFSAYQLWTIYSTKEEVKKETEAYKEIVMEDDSFKPDWTSLQEKNSDIIAWLYIPGCGINFPIVQGTDNEYYLQHTVEGNYNTMGSVFMDYNAHSDFSDDNSIIYGHSVEGGGMVTDLKKFADQQFFNEHPYFYILTPEQNYKCDVWLFSKTQDSSDTYITSFGDFKEESLQKMQQLALYENPMTVDAPLVSISTCDLDYGFHSDRRLVLTAIMHPTDQPIVVEG